MLSNSDFRLVAIPNGQKENLHITQILFLASKKKFALLAKKFFSTSRKKRKGGKILRDAHGPSTLNLLDDNDDEELIDASASLHSGGTDEVLFEPLVSNSSLL